MKPSSKARLISLAPSAAPATQGPGLGQQTGATDQRRTAEEVRKLIEMIMPARQHLTEWEMTFCKDMQEKVEMYGVGLVASGKQVMKLRDTKDRLVEEGLI